MKFMLLLICTILCVNAHAQIDTEDALLSKGLNLEEIGEYEKALEVWGTAFTELEKPSLKIGREYIRLATEKNLRDYYKTASAIYFWGLSGTIDEANREVLNIELKMLEPLVDSALYQKWLNLFDEKDPVLFEEIRKFWDTHNPTLSVVYNERLLEHWERIAYARKNYDRRDDSPYGTDDRGPAYVKYGKPDRVQSGYLKLNRGEVYTDCSILPGCNPGLMPDIVMGMDGNPYYEIWIYDRPNIEMKYNLILMFGERPMDGFRRVEVIEDFIPRAAFSLNENRYAFQSLTGVKTTPGELVTPGMIMQWIYYKQLATTDFFFASRFSELETQWVRFDTEALGKFQGPLQEEINKRITTREQQNTPENLSTNEKLIPEIPIRDFYYRLLDEQNRPMNVIFIETQPQQAFLDDLVFNEDVLFPADTTLDGEVLSWYELKYGLKILNKNNEVLSQMLKKGELILDFSEDQQPSSTVFTVVTPSAQEGTVRLYVELHNRHPDSKPKIDDTPFDSTLRGIGRLVNILPNSLSTDPDQLEMGDLILGWQMQENNRGELLFPFIVANNREIPENEALAIHLEVYNFQMGDNGFTDFRIDYEIQPVRRLEWLRGREEDFSLSISQETTSRRFVENLEIETRELPPGRYRLRLRTTDHLTGQQREREIEFRITESSNGENLGMN